ncbi:hypothetical protein BB561_001983 [Smittium simulii]|uniref:PRP1 splicing factor N-terminal domain-containing protein n=1 Tax=Smittium simulii TaxID=133385 RepID=A0A2T9YS78_9FUNG|nr:hypothetical protein BB561_001983 [Smittium simulii]
MNKNIKDFLGKPAPPNYIAGLSRGATGFTTRSDIGPARESLPEAPQVQQDESNDNQDPENETGLFDSAPYEQDDEEADQIWRTIDNAMDERRRARRQVREKEELKALREQRPAIEEQFSDLRRQLATLSEADWADIPEASNQSGQKRKRDQRSERFSAVPDSVISSINEHLMQPTNQVQNTGIETPLSNTETVTNFAAIGKARDKVLGIKLDQVEGTITETASIDSKGYLTSLSSIAMKSSAEIGDIQKARTLLKSVTTTNPKHAPGWVAAARLEEVAGRMATARQLMKKGCEQCSKNEDIWLESARLNTSDNAKIILGQAVTFLPQSVKIWRAAADLEKDNLKKKRVLRRALEFIPTSVNLWKTLVALEEPYDAKILLSRAVELIPSSIELWVALAKLETYENAKIILNKARKSVSTSHEIWLAAAQLEESQGKPVDLIITRTFKDIKLVMGLGRERWISEAEKSEEQGFPHVAKAIINSAISLGMEDDDELSKLDIWISEAESSVSRGHIETARAIYAFSLKTVSTDAEIWMAAAQLERKYGTPDSLDSLLLRAVEYCPKSESLWLMAAKEKWVWSNDVDGARTVLREAFKFNPNSESIWLAAVKLESSNKEFDRARVLLERARDDKNGAGTARVWLKSIVLERQLKDYNKALSIATTAVEMFPKSPKIWMIKGQIESADLNMYNEARDSYSKGLKHNPNSTPLWILASRLEISAFNLQIKARAILDRARAINPMCPELWLEAVRIEGNNPNLAKSLLSRALKECPKSGLLWGELILRESRQQRKAKSVDALKNCDNNDPVIITTIARLFWSERRIEKARSWFQRSCKLDCNYGDGWAWWLKFEKEQFLLSEKNAPDVNSSISEGLTGNNNLDNSNKDKTNEYSNEIIQNIILSFESAVPKYGEIWQAINKDPKNAFLSLRQLLDLAVEQLPLPMPF